MEEIWLDIKDFEGLYQVSNLGRVKSLERLSPSFNGQSNCIRRIRERILKETFCGRGYRIVVLLKDKKKSYCKVHRLVAEAFIPNPDNLPQVNHKDFDKTNNKVSNLEWVDNLTNFKHYLENKKGR